MEKKHKGKCSNPRRIDSIPQFFHSNALILAIISLFWLLLQSGRKPTRLQYPCQKAAAVNLTIFLIPLLSPFLKKAVDACRTAGFKKTLGICMMTAICGGSLASALYLWGSILDEKYSQQLRDMAPYGHSIGGALGAAAFLTTPHAMAAPSPHRVVSVHHSGATSWNFQCTGTGPCPEYYGDNSFVSQSAVNQMFMSGLTNLTGTVTVQAAWEALLPTYQSDEIIAIKVNFNDSISGGGISGYGDNDAFVDALPQVVNAVIYGLKTRGVPEENIRVFDSSRYIPDRFRDLIIYKNIRYFDQYGNGSEVAESTFNSSLNSSRIDFTTSAYPASISTHKVSDLLVDSDYLINIPIMKKHGGAGITLSLKNHLGSINGFTRGGHAMHDYFYLNGNYYSSSSNPIVDINLNEHFKDKTILIIGDGLYGGWSSNNTPPERWSSFQNDSPNMLFFGIDPVATDSVMFDFLYREGSIIPSSEDILVVAANNGLGVHERWNNDIDRQYKVIDYIELDYDNNPPTAPIGLSATVVSPNRVDLSWEPSTSLNGTIQEYRIYKQNSLLDTTVKTSFSDVGEFPDGMYTYQVSAYDGLESKKSALVSVRFGTPPSGRSGHLFLLLKD